MIINSVSAKKKKIIAIIFFAIFLIQFQSLSAQIKNFNKDYYKLEIHKISSSLKIDGALEEPEWQTAASDSNFWFHYPIDSGKANVKTEIKMMYDESNLYVGFVCYQTFGDPVVQSLKRDDYTGFNNSDAITIVLDPLNTDKSGYYFGVNALGAEVDGTVFQNGMEPSVNYNWNNKWEVSVSRNRDVVFYEIVIPFGAIRYDEKNNSWGINFLRNDPQRNVSYSWTWFSANKHNFDFGFNGTLIFKDGLPENTSNTVMFMPSASSGFFRDDEKEKKTIYKINGGLDAKASIGSAMNLDLTMYPDFSNVAVDQQYIDFYRFEYYMQEQRGFFLENNDVFAGFGTYEDGTTSPTDTRVKPIYTRRFGMIDGENVPIIYGARLSGSIADDLRVGVLNMQTEVFKNQKSQNYSIGAFQYGVLNRSSFKGIFTNRQATNDLSFGKNDYNRTAGAEFDYSTEDGSWTATMKYHNSFSPQKYTDNKFYGGGFTFNTKNYKTHNWINHVDKNYKSDLGFIPRLYYKDPILDTTYRYGFTHINTKHEYYHYLNNNFITICGEYINLNTYLDENGNLNEIKADLGYWSVFANNIHIIFNFTFNKYDLLVPHDVLDNDNPIPAGTYENPSFYFFYESDPREKFKYNASFEYGKYYNGKIFTFSGGPSYTIQPHGTVSLTYSLADINLPKGYGQATYHLIGGKSEISFTTNLFWANLIQYNTQKENINFNSILQWRYAPMSDFFVVIKNDFPQPGIKKKFEISFKLTYWLGII